MAETEQGTSEQSDPTLLRLMSVLSLLGGRGLLERCESVSIGVNTVQVAFHAPNATTSVPVKEPIELGSSKPKDSVTRAREFEAQLREFLPGARIPDFTGGR